jgi:hypothetical protein
MSKLIPIIDSREQIRYAFGSEHFGEPLIKKLEQGDYSLAGFEDIFAIERKMTVSEIAKNLNEKRFADWTARLSSIKHPFIICEFPYSSIVNYPFDEDISKTIRNRIRLRGGYITARLNDLMIKYPNISIIYAGNRKSAEYMAADLMKRVYSEYANN